jgi:diguanylate cyclase (GGDEF)-like protein/PAS domain S-box-containing protein
MTLSRLSQLNRLARDGASQAELLDEAVSAVAELLRLEMAHYLELAPDHGSFVVRAATGWPEGLVGAATVPAGGDRSYASLVLAAREPVWFSDLRTEARFTPSPLLAELGVLSGTSVVVRGHMGEVLGVLGGQSRAERAFSADDADLLQAVADVVSFALLYRRSEARLRALVQNSSELVVVVDRTGALVYSNPAAEAMFGFGPADMAGRSLLGLVHPADRDKAVEAFRRDISQPGAHSATVSRLRTASGDWRVIEVVPTNCLDDPAVAGVVLNARDVTERTNLTRVLRTLSAGNRALVSAPSERSLLADVCRTIADVGGYFAAWAGYVEHDKASSIRPVAYGGELGHMEGMKVLGRMNVTWADDERGRGLVGSAVRSRSVQVADDLSAVGALAPWHATQAAFGLRSGCALPFQLDGEVVGVLVIYATEPNAFGPPEVALLAELADDLSYGIGRLRDAALLQASEQRFRALADEAPIGIIESSPTGQVEYANARASEITGRSVEVLMAQDWLGPVHRDDLAQVLGMAENAKLRRKAVERFRIQRPDGAVRHVRTSVAPKTAQADNGFIVAIEDTTEEVEAQQALAHQAFHDALTGLPNRASFIDRLESELGRRHQGGAGLAVLFLGLDRFKIVNDSLGHEIGDAVLKEVGDRFLKGVRSGETAARFGGDELIFVIHDVRKPEDAVSTAKRLLALLEAPVRSAGRDLRLTGSIGIVIPAAHADATSVLRDAGTAMYRAKASGRDCHALFDEELHRRSVQRLTIEAELRQALARHELEVYYQPVVEPASGRPLGAEALVRWHHPSRGVVPPAEFIPVAEDSGLIRPIGHWVLDQALSQLACWDAQDGGPRLEMMAVNLSARQFDDPETPGRVREVLERHRIAPSRVCMEVTESVVMTDSASTWRSLEAFKELGLRVAVDDFGTGYSSLAYLHAMPVTTLKVDRSFVERLGSTDDSMAVVKAIVEMSHALGLQVVAEGVSAAHLQVLVSDLGCEAAQGFYWARPVPAEEFAGWWRQAARPDVSTLTSS